MIRRFCDACGDELETVEDRASSLIFLLDKTSAVGSGCNLEVRATHAVDGVWNGGDVCVDCIKNAILRGRVMVTPAATR